MPFTDDLKKFRKPGRLKRYVLIGIGSLSVALGALGVVLPLLPTTPFLLLASICYARSSERFYVWLMTNRWCGSYIRNYRERRGLPLQQKVLTLILLWTTMTTSACFFVSNGWVRLLLFGIATGVTLHLLYIPTYKQKENQTADKSETQAVDRKTSSHPVDVL